MPIKNGDFVQLRYTGKVDGQVFDTTEEDVAKKNELGGHAHYGPQIICIGANQLIKGLNDFLIGKDKGKYNVAIQPEHAFGKKDVKLIQLVPTSKFIEQRVRPEVGMAVNIDGVYGLIKTVSGGRTTVDFNHPLSGKTVEYDVEVDEVVTDKKRQVEGLCQAYHLHDAKVSVEGAKATIQVPYDVPEEAKKEFALRIKELTSVETTLENIR